jgi:Carboxypeptidase regulatory-like domain
MSGVPSRVRQCGFMLAFLAVAVLIPSIGSAQATLAGVVKDSSGAVLPGVTVETSSPVLIEKTRTATTDGTGQYQIVDLRPGSYEITFSLSGFRSVTREGVDISGAGVITINADLSVGPLNETLTVRGETPVVDVHSVRRQAVLENRVVTTLPAARLYGAVVAAIPSLQGAGGSAPLSVDSNLFFTAHGGPGNEGRVQLDGLSVGASFNGGGATGNAVDTANARELQVSISGALGERKSADRFSTSCQPPAATLSMARPSAAARENGRKRTIWTRSSEGSGSRSRRH